MNDGDAQGWAGQGGRFRDEPVELAFHITCHDGRQIRAMCGLLRFTRSLPLNILFVYSTASRLILQVRISTCTPGYPVFPRN